MITRAHLAPKLSLPVRDIPLEPPQRDDARLLDGYDPRVLIKHVLPRTRATLPHVDPVPARLEEEGDGLAADEEQPAVGVGRGCLE